VKFYYFGGVFNDPHSLETASKLEEHNFDGVMYTYDSTQGDMFVRVAKDIDPKQKIKYLVAIRPYTISPQYLQTINDSMNEIDKSRVQINFIAGYVKDHESNIHGVMGEITDSSESVDKSKYMIKFIDTLNKMKINKTSLDFYISTTNSYVFEEAKKNNNKIILPYHIYKRGFWSDFYKDPLMKVPIAADSVEKMITMTPIIRETEEELKKLSDYAIRPVWKKGEVSKVLDDAEYFTHESFHEFVKMLEEDGINYLLINAVPRQESAVIIPFIKNYVESRKGFVSN
jgi:hypothetical protein